MSEGAGAMMFVVRVGPAEGGATTTGEPKDDLERFERTLGLPLPALPAVGPLNRESFRLMAASGLRTALGLPKDAFFFAAVGVFLRLALWGAAAAAGGGAGAGAAFAAAVGPPRAWMRPRSMRSRRRMVLWRVQNLSLVPPVFSEFPRFQLSRRNSRHTPDRPEYVDCS